MPVFKLRSELDHAPDEVFAWHARPGSLERLTPPWESVPVLERTGGLDDGGRVVLGLKWVHTHRFDPSPDGGCVVTDEVDWEAPLGQLGRVFTGSHVEGTLRRLFAFRHARLAHDLDLHRRFPSKSLKVAITGSSGLIGTLLGPLLTTAGHEVVPLVRQKELAIDGAVFWDIENDRLAPGELEGVDALVHLAGEPLLGRWDDEKKKAIRESRQRGTWLLSQTLLRMRTPPKVFLTASAVGYYGHRGEEILTEGSAPGKGFLADVCRVWERAADPARKIGVRVVHARLGPVITPSGGALAQMLLPFSMGVGGRLGTGRQYMSWVDADDALGVLYWALTDPSVEGPVNVTAPYPVTNATLTSTLGRVLNRPTLLPVPKLAVRMLFGEMAKEMLLRGQRVLPAKAEAAGYEFRYPGLEESLRHQLGRPEDDGNG